MLEKFLKDKQANFFSNLKFNNDNKIINKPINNNFNNQTIRSNKYDFTVNSENKTKVILLGGKTFSNKFAINNDTKTNDKKSIFNNNSVKSKLNNNTRLKLGYYRRKFSHDNFSVKCINEKINKRYLEDFNIHIDKKLAKKENENENKQIIKNFSKSFDFNNKIIIEESCKGTDNTRKISNILYNLIVKGDDLSNTLRSKEIKNYDKNNLSKFDSLDNLNNLIKSVKKSKDINIIGPTPNVKEIKKNFAFNKSYDSLDVQSEFLISYLRDDDLVSEISESIRTESNKAEEENEINKVNNKQEEVNFNTQNKINYQRTNFVKNKNFQEKVFLNINNKYSKTFNNANNNKNNDNKKEVNFNNFDYGKNKKTETAESLNPENNNLKENKNCCFFKCRTHSGNANNMNLNTKIKKGKKQDANVNSYYSTINNTKRSTNHSFKSIRLNDSLTKLRKRRLSNCTSEKDSKSHIKNSNNNLVNFINMNNNNNKKEKKVNCRCEIF